MQVTICIEADSKEDQALVEAWFARWRDTLAFCSPNQGCGCCVDLWDVDAPLPALRELPDHVFASSEWTDKQFWQDRASLAKARAAQEKWDGQSAPDPPSGQALSD